MLLIDIVSECFQGRSQLKEDFLFFIVQILCDSDVKMSFNDLVQTGLSHCLQRKEVHS